MKSNLLWIWCMVNTILVFMCFMIYGIDCNYDNVQDETISDLDKRITVIEYYNDHRTSDTIVVNNFIEIKK